MLYVIRVFENGGILVSDKKPQVVTSGMFAGVVKLGGKRYQIASLSRFVNNQLNDAELVEYASEYISSLKAGDAISWATATDEPVVVNIDGERVTLTRKWADFDAHKALAAIEAFVNANADVEEPA